MTAEPVRIPVGPQGGVSTVSGLWHASEGASATVALAHGAGAGMTHPFLEGLAIALAGEGFAVLRFVFPYVEAGRRMPGPVAAATSTWAAVQDWCAETSAPGAFVAAGKSYGGRMASLAAADGLVAPAALVYLGYPLHPPGRPDKPRVEHLPRVSPPQLFVEGENDPFVDPHEHLIDAVASCPDARVRWIAGANHSFEVKGARRPPDEIGAGLAPVVADFVRAL
ncbi:MAG: dienelactone hydrolase family protein [Microbacterium enclense]